MGHGIVGQGHAGAFLQERRCLSSGQNKLWQRGTSQSAHNCSHNKVGRCKMMQVTTIVCKSSRYSCPTVRQCTVSFCDVMSLDWIFGQPQSVALHKTILMKLFFSIAFAPSTKGQEYPEWLSGILQYFSDTVYCVYSDAFWRVWVEYICCNLLPYAFSRHCWSPIAINDPQPCVALTADPGPHGHLCQVTENFGEFCYPLVRRTCNESRLVYTRHGSSWSISLSLFGFKRGSWIVMTSGSHKGEAKKAPIFLCAESTHSMSLSYPFSVP